MWNLFLASQGIILNQIKSIKSVGLTQNAVDLIIFACLNFRELLILGISTKFRIREW